jgi:hypothetical protein
MTLELPTLEFWVGKCVEIKVLGGCYLIRFLRSPTSTDQIHTTKLVLHHKFYEEISAKIELQTRPPLI